MNVAAVLVSPVRGPATPSVGDPLYAPLSGPAMSPATVPVASPSGQHPSRPGVTSTCRANDPTGVPTGIWNVRLPCASPLKSSERPRWSVNGSDTLPLMFARESAVKSWTAEARLSQST